MKKMIPTFKTDKQAEDFVAAADLTEYDLSGRQVMRFEMKREDKSVNLRLPEQHLEAVRRRAQDAGIRISGLSAWRSNAPCRGRSETRRAYDSNFGNAVPA